MPHVILVGDSIFDNAAYVPGGPAVIDQLRSALPSDWDATLLAVDGDTTEMVAVRLRDVPRSASHFVVSVGGNDALVYSHLLDADHNIMTDLADARQEFCTRYQEMLNAVLDHSKPTVVCTVYDDIPGLTNAAKTALSPFNDVIIREAARSKVPILDLRLLCNDAADYSEVSPIEPSSRGGEKIARLVAEVVRKHDFKRQSCVVYGG